MESLTKQLVTFATTYGLQVVGAILILIFGRIAAGIGKKIIKRIGIVQNCWHGDNSTDAIWMSK